MNSPKTSLKRAHDGQLDSPCKRMDYGLQQPTVEESTLFTSLLDAFLKQYEPSTVIQEGTVVREKISESEKSKPETRPNSQEREKENVSPEGFTSDTGSFSEMCMNLKGGSIPTQQVIVNGIQMEFESMTMCHKCDDSIMKLFVRRSKYCGHWRQYASYRCTRKGCEATRNIKKAAKQSQKCQVPTLEDTFQVEASKCEPETQPEEDLPKENVSLEGSMIHEDLLKSIKMLLELQESQISKKSPATIKPTSTVQTWSKTCPYPIPTIEVVVNGAIQNIPIMTKCHKCEDSVMKYCTRRSKCGGEMREYSAYRCTRKGCQTYRKI